MKALPIAIMSMFLNVSYAQETDTTKTFVQSKELDEVVVKTSYLTRKDDHILAIPTKITRNRQRRGCLGAAQNILHKYPIHCLAIINFAVLNQRDCATMISVYRKKEILNYHIVYGYGAKKIRTEMLKAGKKPASRGVIRRLINTYERIFKTKGLKTATAYYSKEEEFQAFAHVVCNPSVFAASLMPNSDTPSVVAKQSFDRESIEYTLPKYLHTICKQAMPHCMESDW